MRSSMFDRERRQSDPDSLPGLAMVPGEGNENRQPGALELLTSYSSVSRIVCPWRVPNQRRIGGTMQHLVRGWDELCAARCVRLAGRAALDHQPDVSAATAARAVSKPGYRV